jgi:16S rRNA (cytidine1402-2'-O)-methyltransferase
LAEVLLGVDIVYSEDTRRTSKLLAHVGSEAPLRSLFAGNERSRSAEVVENVRGGDRVALVSDAGVPNVSDPGSAAVRAILDAGLKVEVVPGPSAVTTALAASGFTGDRFCFEGFLPKKGKDRMSRLQRLSVEDRPVVLFVAPHRLVEDLADLSRAVGDDREIAVAREMTKLHEEY